MCSLIFLQRFKKDCASNETIFYSVSFLEEAIQQQKKVIFRYYDLNEHGEKAFRKDGHHYVVEPVGLIFNNDNYYLMVYSAKHDGTANYRIDKMESVEIIDEPISDKALQLRNCVDCFTGQAFKMYGGQPVGITIRFNDNLIGVIFDKFGEDTAIKRINEDAWIPCIRERNGSYSYYSTWREASKDDWANARWYNGIDAAQTADEDKTVVCGHWHASLGHSKYEGKCSEFGADADFSPYYGPRIIAIDACTSHSKEVNVIVIED